MELHRSFILEATTAPIAEDVLPICELAKSFEEAGEFEHAFETLQPFWARLGERPSIDGLSPEGQAELLLRAGTLTGWLGAAKQITGTQELAKDLISESGSRFATLGLTEKVAEASVDLAICYW